MVVPVAGQTGVLFVEELSCCFTNVCSETATGTPGGGVWANMGELGHYTILVHEEENVLFCKSSKYTNICLSIRGPECGPASGK